MNAFLMGLLGAIVGLVLLALAVWFWLKRKLTRFASELGAALQGGVPPFRITLEPCPSAPTWSRPEVVAGISDALAEAGYQDAGDYTIEEMPGVVLRGFVNSGAATLAALYQHPQVPQPLLDVTRLHTDRRHVLATTAPDDGLAHPPGKHVSRFETPADDDAAVDLVAQMHEQVLAHSGERTPVAVTPRMFPMVFTTAYAAEMDWRIARGGVTAEDVTAAAVAGGQEPPGEDDIELVRGIWRSAIDEFVSEEAQRAFLAQGTVSAADWERLRERVMVVHQHSAVDELVETVGDELMDAADGEEDEEALERRHADLVSELRSHLDGADPVDGFAAARGALAALEAYQPLGEVARPWRAALYVRPEPDVVMQA